MPYKSITKGNESYHQYIISQENNAKTYLQFYGVNDKSVIFTSKFDLTRYSKEQLDYFWESHYSSKYLAGCGSLYEEEFIEDIHVLAVLDTKQEAISFIENYKEKL